MKKHKWKKVTAPKTWRPARVNEELIGYYGGQTIRKGSFGEYAVAIIHTENGSFLVSGTVVIQALDCANLKKGAPVRLVWRGMKDIGADTTTGEVRSMKCFDVFIAAQTQTQIDHMLEVAAQSEN